MALLRAPAWPHLPYLAFGQSFSPPGVHYRLRLATWSDGSRAWTDSRGLLHLKSSDPAIPELTFVLHEADMAGWASDGRIWGDRYFVGDRANVSAGEIYHKILVPFLARLR